MRLCLIHGVEARFDADTPLDYDALVEIYYKLPERYHDRIIWLGHPDIFEQAKCLTDNAGQPLWRPSLVSDGSDRLLGQKVVTENDLPPNMLFFGVRNYV